MKIPEFLRRLWHRLGSPRWFYETTASWLPWFAVLGGLLVGTGTVWGLAFAPPDYLQGNSFRIIYVHVPSAILAQSCYLLMAVCGVVLLVWRMKLADMVLAAAAPVGASFTFLALATGSIWGRPTWGTWWEWDARVTSMLILLFLYFGLIGLRRAIERPESAGRACAILAIVGVINIPIIKYSVDWWLTLHQPSTFTLTEKPAMPASMWVPLLLNVIGFYLLFGLMVLQRARVEILERERRTQWVQALTARLTGAPLPDGDGAEQAA
jgi:heme exporter protein C